MNYVKIFKKHIRELNLRESMKSCWSKSPKIFEDGSVWKSLNILSTISQMLFLGIDFEWILLKHSSQAVIAKSHSEILF